MCIFSVFDKTLAIVVGIILFVGLWVWWIWMIVDCVKNEPAEGNNKVIWILVILLGGWIGTLVYQFARRPNRIRQYGK